MPVVFLNLLKKSSCSSLKKTPASSMKLMRTTKISETCGNATWKAPTILTEAVTKNAIEKATIEFKFFRDWSFSTPKILVFSKTAKTIVNTSKKGKITSKSPKSCKKAIAFPNVLAIKKTNESYYKNLMLEQKEKNLRDKQTNY